MRAQVAASAEPTSEKCWFEACKRVATSKPPLRLCEEHEQEASMLLAHLVADRKLWLEAGEHYRPVDSYGPPVDIESSSWVYFMRRESLIKIGYSQNPARRAINLNTVVLAQMRGGPAKEAEMHRRFVRLRTRPRSEWFNPGPDLIAYINDLRAASGKDPIDLQG